MVATLTWRTLPMHHMITAERGQILLMPPSVDEWLPKKHLARFVAEIVDELDLTALSNQYRGSGKQAFSPGLLVSLLFYGYATGTFSSRKIEAATHDSVAFRYLAGNTHPDHDTIAAFRRRFIKQLKPLFAQILLIAREMGLAKVGTVAIDGTKVHANASKHKAMSWKYACRLEKQLKREVEQLLRKAEQADAAETDDQLDIPAEIERREKRLQRIAEAKEAIRQRAQQRHEEALRLLAERKKRRMEKQNGNDKPPAAPAEPRDGDQHNFTDADSRIMKTHGGFEQCYNAQAAVDAEDMLIVGTSLSNCGADATTMTATLDSVHTNTSETPGSVLADAGYMSEANVLQCEERNIEAYIATGREKHNQRMKPGARKRPPPEWSPPRKMMWDRLRSDLGEQMYRYRKMTVEPAFGIIKNVMGFTRFMLRGLDNVTGEWDLVALSYDIRRIWSLKHA